MKNIYDYICECINTPEFTKGIVDGFIYGSIVVFGFLVVYIMIGNS